MNERFRKIANDCFEYIEGTIDGDIVEFNYKKFVKNLIDDIQRHDLVGNDSLEQIKQHFGVEK